MALQQWALPQLANLLPLEQEELKQIITHAETLSDTEVPPYFESLLGESSLALEFTADFIERQSPSAHGNALDNKHIEDAGKSTEFEKHNHLADSGNSTEKVVASDIGGQDTSKSNQDSDAPPPSYATSSGPSASNGVSRAAGKSHSNAVIEAGKVRAKDEQEMQNLLQNLQLSYNIYNSEIEPEHDVDGMCWCAIHKYQSRKFRRYGVQQMWSKAVMYPGEKSYNDNKNTLFNSNPYMYRSITPFGTYPYNQFTYAPARPRPDYHERWVHQTITINNSLNKKAQQDIDAKEPRVSIWDDRALDEIVASLQIGDKKAPVEKSPDEKQPVSVPATPSDERDKDGPSSKRSKFKKFIGIRSREEKALDEEISTQNQYKTLRNAILTEEQGRWPDENWRQTVMVYQEKVGMTNKIADLRARSPIQYLHLLRAGYFEPIPVAWAKQMSNPLKFSIEAREGWRGITPAWRGYEDTAEERLYWVLNHREGSAGSRLKPDQISALNMARDRMARAVAPPPEYYSAIDTCHTQHTSEGYSKQVMPPPFQAYDRPEDATDDTMILMDVSGSMDWDPLRPIYNKYLITQYVRSTQPKNRDVAKAIIRRFIDAMSNHDHQFQGYDLTTFANQGTYIGTVNHDNLESMWRNVRFGGGTRVMTGWQKVKELHFQKHSESATYHPVYGWQAGPQTPMLRLLLLLDGEATDMDEFELDLLGLSWAHVTIFLIGVDGCPHHHRHANELQRISDVNHHVSFVDAQGNAPERLVTHELLKRHLGYEMSMQEFEEMEAPPAYSA